MTPAQPAPTLGSSAAAPGDGVTVIVVAERSAPLWPTLDSLTRQDLDPSLFEILVVVDHRESQVEDVVRRARTTHPGTNVRLLRAPIASRATARNLGIDAARHTFLTFVDAPDTVTASFLRLLLHRADGYTIAVSRVEVVDPAAGTHRVDTPANRGYLRHAGLKIRLGRAPLLAEERGGKLVSSKLARSIRFDETIDADEWILFWARLFTRFNQRAFVLPLGSSAAYIRNGTEPGHAWSYTRQVANRIPLLVAIERWSMDRPAREVPSAALSRGRAQAIGRFLRAEPQYLDRAIDDIKRSTLSRFDFSALNAELAKEVVISYAFPPVNDTSGLVVARRIRERGAPVDVISSDMAPIRKLDPSSIEIAREYVGHHHVVPGPPTFAGWERIEAFCRSGLAFIDAVQCEKGPYESIYSRSMWPAAHFLAALHVVRNPGVTWRAEFSDPLQYASDGTKRLTQLPSSELLDELTVALRHRGFAVPDTNNAFVWIEHLVYTLATSITFTNTNQLQYMLSHLVDPAMGSSIRARAVIEPHPVPPPSSYELARSSYVLDDDRINIGYFGVFYAVRGVGDMLDALESLDVSDRERLRLHIFTDKPAKTRKLVDERGLGDAVVVRPYLPYLEFLNLAARFDWLLVCDARASEVHGINPYLPSKLSDYRGSGAKIWAMVERGSILSGIQLDARSELGDTAAARAVLTSMLPAPATSAPALGLAPDHAGRG